MNVCIHLDKGCFDSNLKYKSLKTLFIRTIFFFLTKSHVFCEINLLKVIYTLTTQLTPVYHPDSMTTMIPKLNNPQGGSLCVSWFVFFYYYYLFNCTESQKVCFQPNNHKQVISGSHMVFLCPRVNLSMPKNPKKCIFQEMYYLLSVIKNV